MESIFKKLNSWWKLKTTGSKYTVQCSVCFKKEANVTKKEAIKFVRDHAHFHGTNLQIRDVKEIMDYLHNPLNKIDFIKTSQYKIMKEL